MSGVDVPLSLFGGRAIHHCTPYDVCTHESLLFAAAKRGIDNDRYRRVLRTGGTFYRNGVADGDAHSLGLGKTGREFGA